jgi:hypothetical protein
MEHLIIVLKEKLISQMNIEIEKIQKIEAGTQRETVLIAAGKMIELEHLIALLDEMLTYDIQTKS